MIRRTMSMMNPVCIKIIIVVIICMVLQVVCGDEHEIECIEREREALFQFKAGIVDRYGMLSSWTTPHCCQWEGIWCDNLTAHVIMLDLHGEVHNEHYFRDSNFETNLPQRYISGEIHKSLMELNQLYYLNLSYNSFLLKQIPYFLASLSNLIYLDLSHSQFGGKIPSQFGSLFRLKYLNLAKNYLEGSIPPHLGNLSELQHLNLSSNYLEGNIPSQLGNLSKLQYLDLRDNYLEGNIPSQLGNLYELQHLDLSDNYLEGNIPSQLGNLSNLQELYLGGGYGGALKIDDGDKWLSNLISLTHLYLYSMPTLNTSQSSLQMTANLPKLRELTLYNCSLSDHFILSLKPSKFNSSTSLSVLDLSGNTFISSTIFQWVSNITSNLIQLDLSENLLEGPTSNDFGTIMTSLERLDLSWNRFKGEDLKSFMIICSLHSLNMQRNNLTEDLPSILRNLSSGCVKHSLQELDLSNNGITGCLPDLSVLSSLRTLVLDQNRLNGKISTDSRLPSQLKMLSIRSNSLEGGIPKSFGSTCTLESLDLSDNKLSEELMVIVNRLSGCSRLRELYLHQNQINGILPDFSMFLKLETLHLSMNQISGTLPNTLSMFPLLKGLYLFENKLNGTIGEDFQFPIGLEELDLSSNSLKGVITDSHFANMAKLNSLDLSDNSLSLTFTQNWVPSFQLFTIRLRSCKIGPTFPQWLQTQNEFQFLDISNARIWDRVPEWFWAKLHMQKGLVMIDVSYNSLSGMIPNSSLKNTYGFLILGSNQFEGPIPPFLRSSLAVDLSNNKFSDSFPFFCASDIAETLRRLDLSSNQLSGQIPDCWSHFKSLVYLNLSHNTFSGNIPTSIGLLLKLEALILRSNDLTDEIPFSLKNCTKLVMLDMAKNRLSGSIPTWIGSKLQELLILSLGGNRFYGSLPFQICYLENIHLLDLSLNNLSGKIPRCIKNLSLTAQKTRYYEGRAYFYYINNPKVYWFYELYALLMWKGLEQMFNDNELSLLKSIDLSSNHFSQEIPIEIENLFGLISLNLSRNHLIGKIPSNIGMLTSLEFLDLSRNQLIGSIPSSLTQIDRLSMLDLSHNNLSGKIPTGTQLQSFNASCYVDNFDLCGLPLNKLCTDGDPTQKPIAKLCEDDSLIFTREFFMGMAIGFVISFGALLGSILIMQSWRHAYIKFLSNLSDAIYVMAAIKVFKQWHRT